MKIKKRVASDAKLILTGMIVNRAVVAAVAAHWQPSLFSEDWANLVGGWCVTYYQRYKRPPLSDIESLFHQWAEGRKDKDTVELVSAFLSGLSADYSRLKKDVQPDVILDVASRYFTKAKAIALKDKLELHLDNNDVDSIEKEVAKFRPVDVGGDRVINVLEDEEANARVFDSSAAVLVKYKGPLGTFFGDELARDSFVSFMGPEKIGKTWALQDVAFTAISQGRKVLFVQAGDLSQDQMMKRFLVRVAGRPYKKTPKDKPVRIPIMIGPPDKEGGIAEVQHEDRMWKNRLNKEWAAKKRRKMLKRLNPTQPLFKLVVRPSLSLSVTGISGIVDKLANSENWVPDVVVIDYADILAADPGVGDDKREAIFTAWAKMRGLSQTYHCLVLTATQVKATGYKTDVLSMEHFADDKRKFGHVTAMIGLNQNREEKLNEVMRMNFVVLRNDEYSISRCVHAAGCRAIARPFMLSTF